MITVTAKSLRFADQLKWRFGPNGHAKRCKPEIAQHSYHRLVYIPADADVFYAYERREAVIRQTRKRTTSTRWVGLTTGI